jgi:hypothetical protein
VSDPDATGQVVPLGTALVWDGARLFGFDGESGRPLWDGATIGLPAPTETVKLAAGDSPLLVPSADGFEQRDLATGDVTATFEASDLPPGGSVTAVGPVLVYRLADRVLGYR